MKTIARLWLFSAILLSTTLAPGQGQKWKFMVYGDTRGTNSSNIINTNIISELARQTTNLNPAFVLVPGDLTYSASPAYFQTWSNTMAPVYQAGIPVYLVRGNHDDDGTTTAFTNFFQFSLPTNGPAGEVRWTYSVSYSNALVLVLDEYLNAHQVNTNWIKAVLATNTCLHVFAMGHEPAFKVNHTDCLDDVPLNRDAFLNILSNTACRVYFCGHDHFYDHLRADDGDHDPSNDIHQMVVGTGGAPLNTGSYNYDGVNSSWAPTRVYHEAQYGYVLVEIDGPLATLTWYHRTGADAYAPTTESFSYSLAPVITPVLTNNLLRLTWQGGGRVESAPAANGPWSTLASGPSPFVQSNLSAAAAFYRVRLR